RSRPVLELLAAPPHARADLRIGALAAFLDARPEAGRLRVGLDAQALPLELQRRAGPASPRHGRLEHRRPVSTGLGRGGIRTLLLAGGLVGALCARLGGWLGLGW